MSTARRTLERARRFLQKARQADPNSERSVLEDHLAAAIVFGRSVTFHLQEEFTACVGFSDWYGGRQKEMQADPLLKFLLEQRNDEIHVRPKRPQRRVAMELTASAVASFSLAEEVRRARPWFRRSPRILLLDARRSLAPLVRKLRLGRRANDLAPGQSASPPGDSARITSDELFFDDAAFGQRPAFDLVRDYLDKLELTVAAAEERFGVSNGER